MKVGTSVLKECECREDAGARAIDDGAKRIYAPSMRGLIPLCPAARSSTVVDCDLLRGVASRSLAPAPMLRISLLRGKSVEDGERRQRPWPSAFMLFDNIVVVAHLNPPASSRY